MPDPPRLTVALPTCNGARHLREALTGIRDQEGAAFDLVVSDDRSDDDTLAIVRDEVGDRARVSVTSERLGLAGNWNRCVELSQTEWVAIFHQDDVMRPGHLAATTRVIASAPLENLGLIAGPVAMIDDKGRPVSPGVVDPGGLRVDVPIGGQDRPTEVTFPPGSWVHLVVSENPLRCSAVTTRKAAHGDVGGFDPSYRYAVDWDFWVRVAHKWGLAWRLDPPTVAMRWHPSSETHRFRTGTTDLDEQSRLLVSLFERDGANLANPRELQARADRRLARAYLNRAHVALKGGDAPLARQCLGRSIRLAPSILATIALDPKLAAQMAALTLAPRMAARWLGRRGD